jgi:hypothetical protein
LHDGLDHHARAHELSISGLSTSIIISSAPQTTTSPCAAAALFDRQPLPAVERWLPSLPCRYPACSIQVQNEAVEGVISFSSCRDTHNGASLFSATLLCALWLLIPSIHALTVHRQCSTGTDCAGDTARRCHCCSPPRKDQLQGHLAPSALSPRELLVSEEVSHDLDRGVHHLRRTRQRKTRANGR